MNVTCLAKPSPYVILSEVEESQKDKKPNLWNGKNADLSSQKVNYASNINTRTGETLNHFRRNNEETLADDATAPWLTQSFAGYLPQLSDQVKAGAEGAAAVGLTSGFMAGASGNPFVAGGALLNGAKAGYMGATATHAYDVMRPKSLRPLLYTSDDPIGELRSRADDIAKSSPIEIPETATINPQYKKNGYYNMPYEWTADDGFKYESRWHTRPPTSPKGQKEMLKNGHWKA